MQEAIITTHGAAKSDPGVAAIAVQLVDASGSALIETTEVIGNATSALAAFTAVVRGLDLSLQEFGSKTTDMSFVLAVSNEAVKRQVNGEDPVTNPAIVPHFIEVHNFRISHFPNLELKLVSPEQSQEINGLVQVALDDA